MPKNNKCSLSLIVPTRNEENIVETNLDALDAHLKSCPKIGDYEILVCDYSTDKTPEIIRNLGKRNSNIKYIAAKKRGIGAGIRVGLDHSSHECVMLYPIDLSWNLNCIAESLDSLERGDGDIILASREHKDSITTRTKKRVFFSKIYNIITNIAFNLDVSDTQCTFAAKRENISKFLDKLDSDSAFLQTQIIIYGRESGLKIKEIATTVKDTRPDSKINVIRDGTQMLKEIILEKTKNRNIEKSTEKNTMKVLQ